MRTCTASKVLILLVFAGVFLTGCIKDSSGRAIKNVELDEEFKLRENQTAVLNGEDFEIKLIDIIYSPCPDGAECFWSGLGANLMAGDTRGNGDGVVFMLLQGQKEVVLGFEIENIAVHPEYAVLRVREGASVTESGDTDLEDIFGEDENIVPPAIPE